MAFKARAVQGKDRARRQWKCDFGRFESRRPSQLNNSYVDTVSGVLAGVKHDIPARESIGASIPTLCFIQ
eukprot:scaffold1657_cov182-Alexandrium_tamarense.AAC.16